jgi:hypothetical protein
MCRFGRPVYRPRFTAAYLVTAILCIRPGETAVFTRKLPMNQSLRSHWWDSTRVVEEAREASFESMHRAKDEIDRALQRPFRDRPIEEEVPLEAQKCHIRIDDRDSDVAFLSCFQNVLAVARRLPDYP